jgi:hypothetical protein
MRIFLTSLLSVLFLTSSLSKVVKPPQELAGGTGNEPDSGSVVCAPSAAASLSFGCVPLGPSLTLLGMAAEGMTYPLTPLPAYAPPEELNEIPYLYYHVNKLGTPLYDSLAAAMAGQSSGRSLAPGTLYVSYVDQVENSSGLFLQLRSGLWIRGDGSHITVPVFQGLLFSSPPRNAFGWVLEKTPAYSAPGLESVKTGLIDYRYTVVQIYTTAEADGLSWGLIGPGEWLQLRYVASVTPRTTLPAGITSGRWIEINLAEQTLAVYQDSQLVFATLVSSGVDAFWTRPGLFQIYEKKTTETMSGSTEANRADYYYLEDVPWTMYFDQERALHGEYWHTSLGYQMSHGCVNMSVGDAHWLYNWASVGDSVYVYDPTGRTPTDSSLYGAGAP